MEMGLIFIVLVCTWYKQPHEIEIMKVHRLCIDVFSFVVGSDPRVELLHHLHLPQPARLLEKEFKNEAAISYSRAMCMAVLPLLLNTNYHYHYHYYNCDCSCSWSSSIWRILFKASASCASKPCNTKNKSLFA